MSRAAFARLALALACLTTLGGSLGAQEVRWRHDYAAARREAAQSSRPLLLDFGTEACIWCKKLDATTFRAPAVVGLLNGRFVPVKVDAERATKLVQALGIQSYPTVILAAADGTILDRHEGYADAARMAEMLGRALQKSAKTPEVIPVSAKAPAGNWDQAREEIARKLAQSHLTRGAELMRQGRSAEAAESLELAVSLSPGTPTATAARDMLAQLPRNAPATRP